MITYHKNIKGQRQMSTYPHSCLDIQEYIESKDVYQSEYLISSNDYYLFIYLLCGDRIDVSL